MASLSETERSCPIRQRIACDLAGSDRRAHYYIAKGSWYVAKRYYSWTCTKQAAKHLGIWILLTTLRTVRGCELVRERHWRRPP